MIADRKPDQYWIEPFVGGNIIDKITGNIIGADINKYTIGALKIIIDKATILFHNNNSYYSVITMSS